jgi:excisionase family DNA binding protein
MPTTLLSPRDYLRIQEAARALGVSEQTLRNWDRSGKLKAQRHPINGYRLYKAADLHALLKTFEGEFPEASAMQLPLGLAPHTGWQVEQAEYASMPDAHWSATVGLDPKHRPQRWDAPSSTVRRDWRKYPQEAYLLDKAGKAYRRLAVEEIAILQGFSPETVAAEGLTNRQKIAAVGDAVPPPLASAILRGVDEGWRWQNKTALEICAGIGGLAEGAASVGLEHRALVDISASCGTLLRNGRHWRADAVHVADVRSFPYEQYRGGIGLLSGGPPCQPWSQGGRHGAQEDARDLLGHLDEVVRVVEPEVFLFENVPGLATAGNAAYLRHVVDRLRAPGPTKYGVMVGLLNAADYGVPQLRRRIFILGFRDRPSSFAGRRFDAIAQLATHRDPGLAGNGRRPWMTIGEAIQGVPDPGGWRRWIGVAA